MRYGKDVADDLAADGLLAIVVEAINPTGWRVKVYDTGHCVLPMNSTWRTPRVPAPLGRQLAVPLWKLMHPNSHYNKYFEGSQDFKTEEGAKRQARMARKCGLEVEIVPLALIELPLLKYNNF